MKRSLKAAWDRNENAYVFRDAEWDKFFDYTMGEDSQVLSLSEFCRRNREHLPECLITLLNCGQKTFEDGVYQILEYFHEDDFAGFFGAPKLIPDEFMRDDSDEPVPSTRLVKSCRELAFSYTIMELRRFAEAGISEDMFNMRYDDLIEKSLIYFPDFYTFRLRRIVEGEDVK